MLQYIADSFFINSSGNSYIPCTLSTNSSVHVLRSELRKIWNTTIQNDIYFLVCSSTFTEHFIDLSITCSLCALILLSPVLLIHQNVTSLSPHSSVYVLFVLFAWTSRNNSIFSLTNLRSIFVIIVPAAFLHFGEWLHYRKTKKKKNNIL
jgi:hypothetical protein